MEHSILKKRLNTFKSAKGTLKDVSDEVVLEVLRAWENWPGVTSDLYREIGISKMQMATMIQKAKRLVKGGIVPPSDFKEVRVETGAGFGSGPCQGIELAWDGGKLIRFSDVSQLVDFLKKVA